MKVMTWVGALLLALFSSHVSAEEATVYRIEKARRDHVTEYVQDGDRFRRGEKIPAERVNGAKILEASTRGYVRVETEAGPVWLDRTEVEINPKLPVKAECLALVSAPIDTTAGIVRGAGGACE